MRRTFYNHPSEQVRAYNDKIRSNLCEYYYLDGLDSMGNIKAININNIKSVYLNEKYHLKIKYISGGKIYSRVYPRESFRGKYIFIKIENRKDPNNLKSIKFCVPIKKFQKMNESSLLKAIAHSQYINQIKESINIDFTIKQRYYYLIKNPIVNPEEYCNYKYNIVDDEYFEKLREITQRNIEFAKNEIGILPNLKFIDDY